ncbi:hypothetical protein D3C87_76840 [compost metagenome]
MNITLAQAVPLKGIIARRIQELIQERNNVSTVTVENGVHAELPARSMEEVTKELEQTREDFRKLDVIMTHANLSNFIKWDNNNITITESIELAKQIRGEVNSLKSFGNRKKQEKENNWRNPLDKPSTTHTTYEPEEYRQKALKLERQVNKLSQDIEAKNHSVEITFVAADRYIEI